MKDTETRLDLLCMAPFLKCILAQHELLDNFTNISSLVVNEQLPYLSVSGEGEPEWVPGEAGGQGGSGSGQQGEGDRRYSVHHTLQNVEAANQTAKDHV